MSYTSICVLYINTSDNSAYQMSVPSSRKSIASWLERRGFSFAGSLPYPSALGHTITTDEVKLDVYLRAISLPGSIFSLEADSKNPPEPTILTLNIPDLQAGTDDDNDVKKKSSPSRAQQQQSIATTSVTRGIPLPPHWRPEMYINQMPSTPPAPSDDPDEGIEVEERTPIDVD